jgi:hypothetical protein
VRARPATAIKALALPAAHYRDLNLSIDVRCRCCHSRCLPFRMMLIEQPHLAAVPLGRILVRLRCQGTCRQPPIRVALVHVVEQSYAAAYNSRSSAWELVLVGA